MITLPPGFRIIREEDLPRIADYLGRYCDNFCIGITCTEQERAERKTEQPDICNCDVALCCRDCLISLAKEEIAALIHAGEPKPKPVISEASADRVALAILEALGR